MAEFNDTDNIYIHCASGYRSTIASSLFKRQGIHNLHNIVGGWDEIKKIEGLEIAKDKSVLN
jgi:rhodanese-related sulfurtransferase